MDKNQIIEYVLNSPENTNPAILGQMIDEVSGPEPSGIVSITSNGMHDVATFASAYVNVQPSGTKNITTNGTHDVKNFATANVNVPSSVDFPNFSFVNNTSISLSCNDSLVVSGGKLTIERVTVAAGQSGRVHGVYIGDSIGMLYTCIQGVGATGKTFTVTSSSNGAIVEVYSNKVESNGMLTIEVYVHASIGRPINITVSEV